MLLDLRSTISPTDSPVTPGSLTGCRKGAVPAALGRRWACGCTPRTRTPRRRVRPGPCPGRTVGSRRAGRHRSQRCALRVGPPRRRRLRGDQQRALRDAATTQARHGARGGQVSAQPRRHRCVAAVGGRCTPALGRRTGPPIPALPGGGRDDGRDRPGGGVRPVVGGAEPAAVPVPRRARRVTDLRDGAPPTDRRRGCRPPLRRTARSRLRGERDGR